MSEAIAAPEEIPPFKLDLGCGKRKREGFHGVDSIAFEGVDTVADLSQPWPWADESVDEAQSSHFVEHLTGTQRIHFFNELYRVMKPGAKASIVTPDWSHACAYGDPTHQWPPMSNWYALYLSKPWRDVNAPHVPYTCDFDHAGGYSSDAWLVGRNPEFVQDAHAHKINSARDLIIHLTKVKRT